MQLHENADTNANILYYLVNGEVDVDLHGWSVIQDLGEYPLVDDEQYCGTGYKLLIKNEKEPNMIYRLTYEDNSWSGSEIVDLVEVQLYYVTRQEYLTPQEYEDTK
jgi:hypothetical protein